jgi:hypothetical protein
LCKAPRQLAQFSLGLGKVEIAGVAMK